MTAVLPEQRITEAGVYDDLSSEAYHADPVPGGSLSSSGARKLLPPNCPARYAYERDHPPAPKRVYDLGHAAHLKVLGAGSELVVIDADNYLTKAAKEARNAAHAEGKVPLLVKEHAVVEEMAAALRAHPWVPRLFNPEHGRPEQSLFWFDDTVKVWRRARLDWLPNRVPGARLILPDYKTCASASLDAIQRAIAQHGYHLQADWYLDAVRALGLAGDLEPAFVFVFQEKEPPYLVTVVQPDPASLRIGRRLNREALRIYAECTRTGHWPGYSDDVELMPLPPYIENRYTEEPW